MIKRIRSEEYKKKQREYNKRKYWEDPESGRARALAWKKENKDRAEEYKRQWNEKNYEKYILRRAKLSSKARNLEFNLSLEDIVIPDLCPYLKVPLTKTLGQGYQKYNASLDRIDSSKGYIKGNVEVISALANRMKAEATNSELVLFSQEVLHRDNSGRYQGP